MTCPADSPEASQYWRILRTAAEAAMVISGRKDRIPTALALAKDHFGWDARQCMDALAVAVKDYRDKVSLLRAGAAMGQDERAKALEDFQVMRGQLRHLLQLEDD